MGNCFSDDVSGGMQAAGGDAFMDDNGRAAVDLFMKSRYGSFASYSVLELSLSASKLRDRDMFSKSDPMVVVYEKKRDGMLEEIGRTEVILNSLNPTWVVKVTVQYQFEVVQPLVFRVYDVDTQFYNVPEKMLKLEEQQFLGEANCLVSEVVTKRSRSLTLSLDSSEHSGQGPRNCGELTIRAEETFSSKTIFELTLYCRDLENKDLFSKSDPFMLISKVSETGPPTPIFKTEVKKNDLNPKWKPVVLSLQQIGSKENPLVLECFNFNNNGRHDLLGKVVKSVVELENIHHDQAGENLFLPFNVGHEIQNKVLKSQIFVDNLVESKKLTFLDYIAAGFELNFMVAIDFTASNGNPRLPDSLHYIDPSGRPNAYQKAILEVGGVLQFYDTDKCYPSWGFGARPIDGPVSHCFNLNGSTYRSEVEGIHGIMAAYNSALRNVSLAGPTLFGPVITAASTIASQALSNRQRAYYILLIITDGVVTDLQESIDAVVKASDLPLSILIVGVGGADFKEMEILDADKGHRLESSTGRVASRDILQFVPFRDVRDGELSMAQSLLAELPGQFLSYMKARDIQPEN